jgi:hypothetical protein
MWGILHEYLGSGISTILGVMDHFIESGCRFASVPGVMVISPMQLMIYLFI